MGRHSKPARVRLHSGATVAAVPAIAGVAAAFCLTPAASASTAAASTATADAGATTIATGAAAAIRSAAASAAPTVAVYTVRRGDSLSSIAGHVYHDRAAWPVLYWQNRKHIQWADDIHVGQVLQVPPEPAQIPRPPAALGPVTAPGPAASPIPLQVGTASISATDVAHSGGVPGGALGACVVARESGGNAQVMNATGHYGLYQFSAATWAAYGGNPADFGHASVAEQSQVFAAALAAGGQSNWAPYDGC